MTPSRLADHSCTVVFNHDCGAGLKWMRLQSEQSFTCSPGQFVMLDLPEPAFHFRRPFSVLDVPEPGIIDIYYKIVGKGTRLMAELAEHNAVHCLGPLGIGFTPPSHPETALYIGGGIGIAPLYFLSKPNARPGHCFYGVRSAAEVGLETPLQAVFGDQLYLATDDGSAGFHGNICQLLETHADKIQAAQEAYICGPTRMMEAAARLLHERNPALQIQVSLEEHMPCGTGACTGCTVVRADQYLPSKVCVEGPVFDARAIRWDGTQLPLNEFCEESPCPL